MGSSANRTVYAAAIVVVCCIGDSGKIGKISPETGFITEYNVPDVEASWNGITVGPDGNLWFTESREPVGLFTNNKIGKISPATGIITEYDVLGSVQLNGITTGPDGNLWFVDGGPGEIDNISPATGVIHRYHFP